MGSGARVGWVGGGKSWELLFLPVALHLFGQKRGAGLSRRKPARQYGPKKIPRLWGMLRCVPSPLVEEQPALDNPDRYSPNILAS